MVIDRTTDLTAVDEPDLLGGIVGVEGDVGVRTPAGWEGRAYRTAAEDDRPGAQIRARAVPYYAWGNRGMGEMRVWVPEQT